MNELEQLLKSNNIEDEILGWRIAYENLDIADLKKFLKEIEEYRKYNTERYRTIGKGLIIIFDKLTIRIGDLWGCSTLEGSLGSMKHWKTYDYRTTGITEE